MKTAAECATARWTLSILAEVDDPLSLLLELGVLLAESFALGCRFLSVSDPFGAARLEQTLSVFQIGAHLLELQRRLLFEGGSTLDLRMPVLEPGDFLQQRTFRLDQGLSPAFLAIEDVERLQLDVEREQRLDGQQQAIELRMRGGNALELSCDSLRVAVECGLFFLRHRDLCEKLRRLLALLLRHFPARLDRHHFPLAHGTLVRSLLRLCFSLFLPARSLRQRAQH
jgi:hypothetical protein